MAMSGKKYARKAQLAQEEALADARAIQEEQYNLNRSDLAPYRDVGGNALSRLASMYGLGQTEMQKLGPELKAPVRPDEFKPVQTSMGRGLAGLPGRAIGAAVRKQNEQGQQAYNQAMQQYEQDLAAYEADQAARAAVANQPATAQPPQNNFDEFYNSPDYQFALEQGKRSADQSLSRQGLTNSGAALKELTRFGQGMASQQLGNYKNQLASLAGIGQNATNTGVQVGQNFGNNMANNSMALGDARATSYQQQGKALGDTLGTLGNIGGMIATGGFSTGLSGLAGIASPQRLGSTQQGYSAKYMNGWQQ